jgi:hypothetical protein
LVNLALNLTQHVVAVGSLGTRLRIVINLVNLALKLTQHVIAIGSLGTRLTIAINLVNLCSTKVDATCSSYWVT